MFNMDRKYLSFSRYLMGGTPGMGHMKPTGQASQVMFPPRLYSPEPQGVSAPDAHSYPARHNMQLAPPCKIYHVKLGRFTARIFNQSFYQSNFFY